MNKKELEKINKLCKKAHAKGAAAQFMLRGLTPQETVFATTKTASVVDNLYKVASYRKEILKAAFREHLASR
jgi:hypothetical protein